MPVAPPLVSISMIVVFGFYCIMWLIHHHLTVKKGLSPLHSRVIFVAKVKDVAFVISCIMTIIFWCAALMPLSGEKAIHITIMGLMLCAILNVALMVGSVVYAVYKNRHPGKGTGHAKAAGEVFINSLVAGSFFGVVAFVLLIIEYFMK